jgi:hypothetical protein
VTREKKFVGTQTIERREAEKEETYPIEFIGAGT